MRIHQGRCTSTLSALVLLCTCAAFAWSAGEPTHQRVLLATTTSAANSGLLDLLLPQFEIETGIHVDALVVGSGIALQYGESGDVDVLLTHDPEAERRFVAGGFGLARLPLMSSDFVLLGPRSDPASVAGSLNVEEAFRRVAAREATFVSRGDSSGTHMREREIWRRAGVTPAGPWYLDAGQGMATCLNLASEKSAYTLSDRGTFLALRKQMQLSILVEGDSILANPYSIIAVSPARRRGGNIEGAQRLIEWLRSPAGQQRIGALRIEGEPLFFPLPAGEGPM